MSTPSPAVFIRAPWSQPQAMFRELVAAPAFEPLTLAEAKLIAGLSWAPDDPREPMLTGYIRAARAKVEHDTGLALPAQTWKLTINTWVAPGVLPLPPQATPVRTLTANGEPFVWTVQGGAIVFATAPYAPYVVEVEAGWPDVDTLKAEAPLLVHAVGLLVAHFVTVGRDLASSDGPELVPYGYDESINPYRLIWLV